jgi:hypothetical protein
LSLTEPSFSPVGKSSKYDANQLDELANKTKKEDFNNKVIEWTQSAYKRCRTMRQQIERQWYLNLAFYIGRQNVTAIQAGTGNTAGTRLYIPPAPYYRSRPVINRIRPIIRTELAKLTAQKPTASIVPSTGEDRDLAAAQAGEQIWDSVYRDKKIKSIFGRSMLWTLTCGVGFMKTYWDANKKDKAGQPGDFCYETVSPFHIFIPDMLTQDLEDQPYVIHIQTKSPEWVKANYPQVNPVPNVMAADDILNDSFLNLVGAGDYRKNSILCYEVWAKPGQVEFLPKGGMFTIIGDTIVQMVEGNPYMHQQYPYVKFEHIPTGRFYADSIIVDLMPIQREYNRTRGQMIEAKNRMGHPQLLAAEGSVDASKINTEPGQVITYKLGYPPPEPLPLQNLPAYIVQESDRLLQDFEDISGQHAVSKGQVPPGVTAATAISFLQEQDESMLSTTFGSIEDGFEKIGYQTLCYVKQYWNTQRTVKVVGRDGTFNVLSFAGSDLRDNTDIRIEAGSALPTSKSAKQALLMDLMSQGFIPPEKGLELMDVGGVQRLYEDIQVDGAQATRENMKMSTVTDQNLEDYLNTFMGPMDPTTGQQQLIDPNTQAPLVDAMGQPTAPPLIVPVNSFDNHEAHIAAHNNYRKGQEYEELEQRIKDLFEEHVNQHMMALGVMPGMPAPDPNANQVTSGQVASSGLPVPPEEDPAAQQQSQGPPPDSQGQVM